MFKSTEILFFEKYTFNDTGYEAPHYGLVIVPSKHTRFKESILCAVMTSKPVKYKYGTHTLQETDYEPLRADTTIRLRDFDYIHHTGLHPHVNQPVTKLTSQDARKCFKILKGLLFSNASPIANTDPYLRGTIIREWKKAL